MNRIASLTAAVAATFALAPVAAASSPPFQSVEIVRQVSPRLPSQVAVSAPADLAPDDAHLVVQVKGPDGNQVAVTKLDGTGFTCVTCGAVAAAFKPTVSADGQKMFFADNKGDNTQQGNPFSGGTGDFNWSILECAPSVYDCRTRAVLPVRFPIAGLSQGAQNREAKFDPLAQYVSWNEVRSLDGTRVTIARLRRDGDHYTLVEPRVLNPSGAAGLAGAVDAGRFYEGANFADGGRTLTYQTTSTGLNYDSWRIDLQTGRREQLSGELDYNEISRYSPDGRTVFYSSARGLDRMSVFTQLVRPSLIDMATFGAIGRVGLHGNRGCMQGGWLAARDVAQTPGGYAGQPLLLGGDDRNVRDWEWFADGRRALVSLQPFTKAKTAKDTPAALYIVRLPGLRPRRALPTRSLDDFPWRRWTVPSDSYRDMFSTIGRTVVPGPRGGTVTLDRSGFFAAGAWTVTYRGFSDDGRTFIDGTESFTTVVPTLVSRYAVDLRQRGAHTGSMKGDLTIGAQTSFRGQMTSTVDGRTLRGVPQEDSCPGARQPVLRVAGRPGAARDGHRTLRISVAATPPGGRTSHPVAGAAVRVAARPRSGLRLRARTDSRGRATLVVPAAGRWRVHASAGTFRAAARTIRR